MNHSNIKRYEINHDDTDFYMEVEIDHDKFTEQAQNEINEFWSGADDRLGEENGNLLHAVLKLLAHTVMCLQVEYRYNTSGIVRAFDWDAEFGPRGQEGWPKMDGSDGIKIVHVGEVEFAPSDMDVREVSRG